MRKNDAAISEELKADIRIMHKLEKIDDVLKNLIKANQKELKHITDKYFVWYNLALIYHQRGSKDAAVFFIEKIYKDILVFKEDYEYNYNNVLWLYCSINKEKKSIDELVSLYQQIHTYYKKKQDIRNEAGVLCEIYKLNRDSKAILELFLDILTNYKEEDDLIECMLIDCKQIDEECYREALEIMNNFEKNAINFRK